MGGGGGGVKILNFNSFWGFHEKKMNLFRGGGVYEEIVDIFWGQLQIGLFWGSFLCILGLFKDQGTEWECFLGDHKLSFFGGVGVCLIFLFWGGDKQ